MTNSYIPDGFNVEDGYVELPSGFTLQLNKTLKWELCAEDSYYSTELTLETKEAFEQFCGVFK